MKSSTKFCSLLLLLEHAYALITPSASTNISYPTILRPNNGNWYVLRDLDQNATDYYTVETDFEEQYIDGQTTVKHLFLSVLTDYNSTNRQPTFDRLTQIFASARLKNYMIIFRAHYIGGEPSDFSLVQADLAVWVPFLSKNTDVLYIMQAGWLGQAYGEWWGTATTPDSDDGSNADIRFKKQYVINQLLAIPNNMTISMRSIRDIANYFTGTERVGFHDDCILAEGPDGSDTGTYDKGSIYWADNDITSSRTFARNEVRSLRGGESCPGAYSDTMSCETLLNYVKTYKLSYLNMEFPTRIDAIWKSTLSTDISCIQAITKELKVNG